LQNASEVLLHRYFGNREDIQPAKTCYSYAQRFKGFSFGEPLLGNLAKAQLNFGKGGQLNEN